MGGGKGGGGSKGGSSLSPEIQQGLLSNQTALTDIAKTQETRSGQLFETTIPGLNIAENWYQELASGDPAAISKAIAPGAQQISAQTAGAKRNIMENAPAGGEKNLALEMSDVARGSEIGKLAAGATAGAPNALAQIGAQGAGLATSMAGTGVSAFGAGSQTLGTLGNLQIEDAQVQAQNKGSQLGTMASLAATGAELAIAFA